MKIKLWRTNGQGKYRDRPIRCNVYPQTELLKALKFSQLRAIAKHVAGYGYGFCCSQYYSLPHLNWRRSC